MTNQERPTIIKIMPDYGPCYASDEESCAFDISGVFSDHPNIDAIKEIEEELYGLATWIDSGEADNNPEFPWADFDAQALTLSKAMSRLLGDTGIPVIYRVHYNNPRSKLKKEIDVSSSA